MSRGDETDAAVRALGRALDRTRGLALPQPGEDEHTARLRLELRLQREELRNLLLRLRRSEPEGHLIGRASEGCSSLERQAQRLSETLGREKPGQAGPNSKPTTQQRDEPL